MEQTPSCIGISLIKKKIGSKYLEVNASTLLRKEHVKRIRRDFEQIEQWECYIKNEPYNKEKTKSKYGLNKSLDLRPMFNNPWGE